MEERKLKNTVRRIWRWSWLFTLPVTAVFFIWIVSTAFMYHDFKLRYVPTMDLRLGDMGRLQAGFLASELKGVLMPRSARDEEGLGKVQLFITEGGMNRLDADLPASGMDYVKGKLLYPDGELHRVKVRYRGDFSYHWSGPKKSLRVKTKKSKLYEGMRHFNLIIPKSPSIMSNYLSYLLARRLGLMAPAPELVEVFINGEYKGVELKAEQPREQFLRRLGKMPGDLYSGEIVGRDKFPGLPGEVFLNAGFWTKDAVNNHNPPGWNRALAELTSAVYNEDMDRVMELIDVESWAGLAAFMTLSQTIHIDAMHNWRLYFDPARGRFYPVVWDPLGWDISGYMETLKEQSNRFDVVTTIVLERLHRDQRFLLAKQGKIEGFFEGGGEGYMLSLLDDTSRLEASLKSDFNLHFASTYILTPGEVLTEMARFKEAVRETLAEVRRAYIESPPEADWSVDEDSGEVRLNVRGLVPVRVVEMDLADGAGIEARGRSVASFVRDGRVEDRDVTAGVTETGGTVRVEIPFLSNRKMTPPKGSGKILVRDAEIVPATYALKVAGLDPEKILRIRAGRSDEKLVELSRSPDTVVHALDGAFGAVPVKKSPPAVTWDGDRLVTGVVEVDGDLAVMPGTTVRLAPGASVIIGGRLTAVGTETRPVRFVPAGDGNGPWGAVVLKGRGADGSVLRNCEFRGGSGLRHDLVEYSAMLSIHDARGVVIDSCSFADNSVVDDMVHAVYSDVAITGSSFSGALSDALDLDYVTGTVADTSFAGSGNDALDLMSSTVTVTNCRMSSSGDKGLSVGEGARAFVWDTTFAGNNIGVQSKDGSRAVLYNVEMTGNGKTIDAYRKNWQYGDGGHVYVFKSVLAGAEPTLTSDKDSTVMVYDTYLDGAPGKKKKRIHIDPTVDSDPDYARSARTGESHVETIREMGFDGGYLDLVDPDRRGPDGMGPGARGGAGHEA